MGMLTMLQVSTSILSSLAPLAKELPTWLTVVTKVGQDSSW